MNEVTFKEFSALANELGWTTEMLMERFADTGIKADFFERAISCRWRNPEGRYEDRSGVVIPYKSVLQFYANELRTWRERTEQVPPYTSVAQWIQRSRAGRANKGLRSSQPPPEPTQEGSKQKGG